jgi:hypothetical protein
MSRRTAVLSAFALGALAPFAAAQSLTTLPGFEIEALVGQTDVILSGGFGGTAATHEAGVTESLPGAKIILDSNLDGSVHVGMQFGPEGQEPRRWTEANGWKDMPLAPEATVANSAPLGMSDDGDVVVGYGRGGDPFAPNFFAWRWTEAAGTVALTDPLTDASLAYVVSGNGERVGGNRAIVGVTASLPTLWDENGQPQDVFEPGQPGYGVAGLITVLNSDGLRGAGLVGSSPFVWSKTGGAVILPRLDGIPSFWDMRPQGMADDGSMVFGDVTGVFGGESWIWVEGLGTRTVASLAAQLELVPAASSSPFQWARDCHRDGLTLAGHQPNAGSSDGWVLELPAGGVGLIADLGQGLSGDYTPEAACFGTLAGGATTRLTLTGAQPSLDGHWVVGLSRVDAPLKGGVLVPHPDLLVPFLTKPDGTLALDFAWPVGVPSGFSTYVQGWMKDTGAPKNFAATNALELKAP